MAGSMAGAGVLFGARTVARQATPATAQKDKIQIATSMPILADFVQNVAGDRAEVFSIMPENADPHTWEASPQDFVQVSEADSFISLGAHLEPFVESGGWRRAVMDAGFRNWC
jgi:ABC-type Zn uptake system ZnuABC Zn-binding protein ZnuA